MGDGDERGERLQQLFPHGAGDETGGVDLEERG